MSNWISVKDKLPKNDTEVLCFSKTFYIARCYSENCLEITWQESIEFLEINPSH